MAALSGLDAEKMKLVQDLELEMMTDMYARLTNACHKKCIAPKYREADLQKVSDTLSSCVLVASFISNNNLIDSGRKRVHRPLRGQVP